MPGQVPSERSEGVTDSAGLKVMEGTGAILGDFAARSCLQTANSQSGRQELHLPSNAAPPKLLDHERGNHIAHAPAQPTNGETPGEKVGGGHLLTQQVVLRHGAVAGLCGRRSARRRPRQLHWTTRQRALRCGQNGGLPIVKTRQHKPDQRNESQIQ